MVHHQSPDLAALFRTHLPKVLRGIRCAGVEARDAEDVAQDVWIIVNRALIRFDYTRPIEPWLMSITRRTARDFREAAPRREEPTDEIDGEAEGDDPERSTLAREAARLFSVLVASMPEHERDVYVMTEIEGMTLPEIATALDIPIGTATSRLGRGRASFDAAIERGRAAEQHQQRRTTKSAAFLPVLLANPDRILDAVRQLPEIASATAARIWTRVTTSIASAALAGVAATGIAFTARQMVAGIVGALLVGAASGGGIVYAVTHHQASPSSAAIVQPVETARDTSIGAAPVAAVETSRPVVALPVASATPSIVAAPVAPSASAPSTDRAELALLDRARSALARGDAAGALATLQRHRLTYPRGVYSPERDALIQRANARLPESTGENQ